MQAANDGAVSLAQELELAQDDLESKLRLIFGEHHMTVAVYGAQPGRPRRYRQPKSATLSATSGINLISEAFGGAWPQFHGAASPGTHGARSRKAAIHETTTSRFANFHRTLASARPGGKSLGRADHACSHDNPSSSGLFRFTFHEQGAPDREPTAAYT